MRKSIKNYSVVFVLAILLVTSVAYAKVNIPAATSDFYVNDFANVFTSSEKTRLMERAVALSNEHNGIQVVVTTVKSLDGSSIEDYAYEMYNQYGIGKDDMGMLILLATSDRKIRVEVGKAMEAYINDAKAGRFIDNYAIPSLREKKYNEGLISLQYALITEVISCIEKHASDTNVSSNTESKTALSSAVGIFLILLVIALIVFAVFLIFRTNARKEEIESLKAKIKRLEKENAKSEESANNTAESLNGKLSNLIAKNDSLELQYQKLQKDYETLKDRYERAKKIHPDVDAKVTAIINEEIRKKDMAVAKKADSVIEQVINLTASRDIVPELTKARDVFLSLTAKQKSYVKSDVTKLNGLYDEALKLKQEYNRKRREEKNKKMAKDAAEEISAIICAISVGRASNFSRLKEAKSIYDCLDSGARLYFDKSILNRLNRLYKQAKVDKEDRRHSSSGYSSFGHSSSSDFGSFGGFSGFGGFGGSSGGGGASRGF